MPCRLFSCNKVSQIQDIEELKLIAGQSKNIVLYDNLRRDQLEVVNLGDSQVKKGWLIRFASDFIIMPSIQDASPMLAPEAKIMGSLLVSSGVQGLKDVTSSYDGQNLESFNGFTYFLPEAYNYDKAVDYRKNPIAVADLQKALDQAIDLWRSLSVPQKTNIVKRVIQEGLGFDWNNQFKMYEDMYDKTTSFDEEEMRDFEEKHNLIRP